MIKSQEKLAQITRSKLRQDFEDFSENQEQLIEEKVLDQTLDPQDFQNVLLNSKLIKDILSQFSDLSKIMNKLEPNMEKSFAEQRTDLINDKLDLIHKSSFEMLIVQNLKFMSTAGLAEMILYEDEMKNIFNGLDQKKYYN